MVEKLRLLRYLNNDFMNKPVNNELFKFNHFPFYNEHGWDLDIKLFNKQMKNIMKGRKDQCSNTEIQQQFRKMMRTTFKNFKILYTDGSKNKDGTAYAYCNEDGNEGNKVKILNQDTSIFVAEATAIRDCLRYIESNYSSGDFGIVSDSLSVITAIESKCNNYKRHQIIGVILDLLKKLINMNYVIIIIWAPSHGGIKGNEAVDKLAKEAITNPISTIDEPLHFSDLHSAQGKKQSERWQEQWNSSDKGRFCFSIIPKINNVPWYQDVPFSRKRTVFWNRIMANHTTCNASLNRFNIVDDPKCQCGKFHTVDHILFECHQTRKQSVINKLKTIGYHEPLYIRDIVGVELRKKNYSGMIIIADGFNDE